MDLSEVQDFSMSKKISSANAAAAAAVVALSQGNKGKLDDMLSKLMKKNNYVSPVEPFANTKRDLIEPFCTVQQPPPEEPSSGGKEKRRRKLDEIVLGLSAAKEQKTFSDPLLSSPSLKKQIPPSVSVTPASGPSSSSSQQSSQKPFSITVTSVPGSSSRE